MRCPSWRPVAAAALSLLALAVATSLVSCRSRGSTADIRHVLLISIDTCRADHLGCYGFPRPTTPNIDAVAKSGALFEQVASPVPLTLPAHSTLLTGLTPLQHGVHDNLDYRLGPSHVTLAEHLASQGFDTGAVISTFVLDAKFGLNQGFDTYLDHFDAKRELPGEINERKGEEATRLALQWISENRDRRSFLFLHYYDPHTFYEPPEPFASRFADNLYAGEIAYTDHCIGQVVSHLKKLGIYDSTLLIIVGDHGEMLNEHGEYAHGYFVYEAAIKVPLIVRLPGQRSSRRVPGLVGLVDVMPTVCGLLGIEPPPDLHGEDLTRCIVGNETPRVDREVYCESLTPTKYGANALLGLVTPQWKYIETTRPELYDLASDPREANNLIAARPRVAAALHERLASLLEQQTAADVESEIELDQGDRQRLAALGYVAGGRVDDDLLIDANRPDPKDLIVFHEARGKLDVLLFHNRLDEAERVCNELLQRIPDYADAHFHLASIAAKRGEPATSIARYRRVLELDPAHVEAHTNLATELESAGQRDEAIRHLQLAIAADAESPEAHHNLASLLARGGRLDEAIELYRRAIELDADYADAHYHLAMALSTRGQSATAVPHFREAIRLRPRWPEALNAAAWILATHPRDDVRDAPEALRMAQNAAGLTGRQNPWVLDTLAAAYAANGRYDAAAAAAREALALLAGPETAELVDKIRARLVLYERHQPYRDSAISAIP